MCCWQSDAGLFCWAFGYCEAPAWVWGYMAVPGHERLHSSPLGGGWRPSFCCCLHDSGWLWGQYQWISVCVPILSIILIYFKCYFISSLLYRMGSSAVLRMLSVEISSNIWNSENQERVEFTISATGISVRMSRVAALPGHDFLLRLTNRVMYKC